VQRLNINVDGAVRDEDTFVVGDDEDESGDEQTGGPDCRPSSPPPPYVASLPAMPMDELEPSTPEVSTASEASHTNTANGSSTEISTPSPSQYYIKPGDNLLGIALRFGVNGRELCRLNNLPPSTLTTTPHILHTRVSLTLPLSARSKSKSPLNGADPTADKEQEARITRQRAEKRLQTLTKEVDWRVAKAYVALADTPDIDADDMKGKELHEDDERLGSGGSKTNLEGRAVARYLDDEEWEKKAGMKVSIQGFPYFADRKCNGGRGSSSRSLWAWKS